MSTTTASVDLVDVISLVVAIAAMLVAARAESRARSEAKMAIGVLK